MLTKYEHICHPLFLTMAGGLNFPPFIFGVLGFLEWCPYFSNWLVGNAVLAASNIIMSMYCIYKIRKSTKRTESPVETNDEEIATSVKGRDSETDSNSQSNDPPNTMRISRERGCCSKLIHYRTPSSDRIRHLVCYDGIITTYSIVFIVWVLWLSEGSQRINQADTVMGEEEERFEGCMAYHERYVASSLVCGFSYFGFVIAAALASLCSRQRPIEK